MSRRFGNDRTHQDKARAHYLALHGPQARRENAKERDEVRAERSDQAQLDIIAIRQKNGKDKGASAKEIKRLQTRLVAKAKADVEKLDVPPTPEQDRKVRKHKENARGRK